MAGTSGLTRCDFIFPWYELIVLCTMNTCTNLLENLNAIILIMKVFNILYFILYKGTRSKKIDYDSLNDRSISLIKILLYYNIIYFIIN